MAEDRGLPQCAAVIGCGVIGAAWAARFRLRGIGVRAFDPSPAAADVLADVFDNAVRAWDQLGLDTAGAGPIELCTSIDDAVVGAEIIQENVPEDLAVKHAALAAIDARADPDALIASSTSGFRPTVLAEPLTRPDRLIVAHPFNPVYLIPLVEVVAGSATDPAQVARAMSIYAGLGMHPLQVRTEIDAFIADRLLEAVWREALWLVNDGVATTAEIDDAIRFGFGLRWAQMGLFETYRIAGGEGGMAHFIRQFGPCLEWPWSKLTDVPELTEELIQRISDQSDAQSGQIGLRDLERIRDTNLASILLALEANDWGAGQTLRSMRRQ
jgi:carnitine 3-dehydrogenase